MPSLAHRHIRGGARWILALPLAALCATGPAAPPATALAPETRAAAPARSTAAEPDPGLIGVRLVDAPVVRRDDPRAMTYVVDHLEPGTTIRRQLEISNKSDQQRDVQLYAGAASIEENRFTFADGRKGNDLTGWTRIEPARLTVGPHERFKVKVTIKVPRTAAPGERYGVLWGESAQQPDRSHNIGVISRVGVRVYLDVANGGEYSAFRVDKVGARRDKDGRAEVIAHVRNTGKRALDLEGDLRLTEGPGGLSAGPYQVVPGTTLPPGGSGTVLVRIPDGLPAGPWRAELRARSGSVKHTVDAELTFPEPGTTVSARLLDATGLNNWYGAGVAAAGILAAGTVFVWLWRRRGGSAPGAGG